MITSLIFSFLLSPNALLIAAAVVPAAVLMVYVYRQDRLEHESTGLLIGLMLVGALATVLAVLTESIGAVALAWYLPSGEDSLAYDVWMYFIVVGLSEEGFKYLMLRWRTWRSKEFNCGFDGVVYAVFVSLGFALLENVGYVLIYGLGAALMRAITAIPGHASFGVFMGACYGMARGCKSRGEQGKCRLWNTLALLLPMLIHGFYDFIAIGGSEGGIMTFIVFVLIVFASAFLLARRLSKADRYISF